jgi:formate dehydrogenase subunit beta
MRATIELVKLGQVDLGNLTLISMDCPGALPLAGFAEDPEKGISTFEKATRNWEDVDMRPICRICHRGSAISGDLHIGLLSGSRSSLHLISNSNNGKEIIEKLGLTPTEDIDVWKSEVQRISQRRLARREKWHAEFENRVGGVDNLLINLASCINCHNCMRVCPVCYCRLCYFDSERTRHPADDYLDQAVSKGCLRFPPDMLLFHIGRMAHMSLTCVSCGSCEDACPASIPIAQIFSFVADMTQHTFDYVAGRSIDDPLPLSVYREDEFQEGDERDG